MWARRERKYERLLILLVWLLAMVWALVQCSHLQTHEGKCDEALKKYNNAMETYRLYYPVQNATVQAKWKKEIAPKLKKMSNAVDICPTDVSGYDTAMMVWEVVEKEFLLQGIQPKEG
ncbi:MAG: hypothetical protein ACW99G_22160 [Candidatus Thorarchaeota archaeon]|jgi:hypothetical protein